MEPKQYMPLDLPRDCRHLAKNIDAGTMALLDKITQKALAEGRWRSNEHMLFNVKDPEFIAYWLHKTISPLTSAIKGSGVEEVLAPYKKTWFDLTSDGFQIEKTYRLSAVGDLMFAKYLEESKDRLYQNLKELIFDADISYGNLESTLTRDPIKDFAVDEIGETPHINITLDQYYSLTKHGEQRFDVLQLANNHILDCGESGLMVTVDQLKQDKIAYLGVYETEADARAPQVTTLDGIKIGWVTHTFGVNDKPYPENKPWICNRTPFHYEDDPDTSRIEKQIQDCRAAGCDLVFVALHWGLEHECYPHPDQLKYAHRFAEIGADAIIGHHPHVPQPVEIFTPTNYPEKSVPILYSLGNLTPAYAGPATVLSLIANLNISKGELNGESKTMISGLAMTPVVFMQERDTGKDFATIVPLTDLNNMVLDDETSAYVSEINRFAEVVLGKDWKTDGFSRLR